MLLLKAACIIVGEAMLFLASIPLPSSFDDDGFGKRSRNERLRTAGFFFLCGVLLNTLGWVVL